MNSLFGSPSHTATAFRSPGRVLALAVALARLAGFAAGAGAGAQPDNADSLKAIDVLITIELKSGNRVLRLKDPDGMDSLSHAAAGMGRDRFDRLVADTGVAREIRTVEEFRAYWSKLEARSGFKAMKGQYSSQDIDRTLVPKVYLFDSSVVVFPGWVVVRKKTRR